MHRFGCPCEEDNKADCICTQLELRDAKVREGKLEKELARLTDLARRWNSCMSDLGLAGSEFIDDPERCMRNLRDVQSVVLSLAKERNELRKALEDVNKTNDTPTTAEAMDRPPRDYSAKY